MPDKKKYILLFFAIFISINANSQFYNGHQMTFGKNRVQYNNFFWQYYRFQRFDTYFYQDGRQVANYAALKINQYLPQIERFFDYRLQNRIIFLIFNRLTDFRQSNIGLVTGDVETNTGGVTQIIDNKVFLYFNGNHQDFDRQIKEAIAKVIITQMLYGGSFTNKMTNKTLITLPDWFESGLTSYVANRWSVEVENKVKDYFTSGKYKRFNTLRNQDAKYIGHSIWYYIDKTYGKDAISNIIYFTRINKNIDAGFSYTIGLSVKQFTPEWKQFYKDYFDNESGAFNEDYGNSILKKYKKKRIYSKAKPSPDGRYIAYTTNYLGRIKLLVFDTRTGKTKKIFRVGHRIKQITDNTFPALAWHPKGTNLVFVTEEHGYIYLYQYFPETQEINRRMLVGFDKVLDIDFADDGRYIAMSADENGFTDIFIYDMISGMAKRITHDLPDDINPRFINNSEKIVFSSNRISDTIVKQKKIEDIENIANSYDLFVYDPKNKNKLTRLTNTPVYNEIFAQEYKQNNFIYLSDESGIFNRKSLTYDSTISYIDTTVHYRYFSVSKPITNYYSSILEQNFNKNNNIILDIQLLDKKQQFFDRNFEQKYINKTGKTQYIKHLVKKYKRDSIKKVRQQAKQLQLEKLIDSLQKHPSAAIKHPDSINIDINNYVFEKEKTVRYKLYSEKYDKERNDTNFFPKRHLYYTAFYPNKFVTQIDFGVLNESYQVFTGGPYYFNPGMNMFTKIGIQDLFEDYKITGAFRMADLFNSFEYLVSVENLKKRTDKQYIYHRKSFVSTDGYEATKVITNELMYILRYPFNQVSAIKGTMSLRSDRGMYLSTDYQYLLAPEYYQVFASAKGEYIFDNTLDLGLNLRDGIRTKLFAEFYQQVEGRYDWMVVLGADFRFYKEIYRNMIFATRFATSTSFGSGKLIYYLGGVDNWTPLMPNSVMFDQTINIDQNENYIYQAVATNMRGFIQNARNGNNFMLINNEIRLPVFRFLANRPISSDFFNNFQVVGFFDVGSAWTGMSPFSKENAYNNYTIENGPITVNIDVDRAPVLAGFGWGIRSRLFGYIVRLDWAWGIERNYILPRVMYFSLNLDF